MTRAYDAFSGRINRDLEIPPVDYKIPYRLPKGSKTAEGAAWPRLSGKDYILARLRREAWEPGKIETFFRIRLVRRKSFMQHHADHGPVVWLGSPSTLISWQYDHDLYFGRTEGGRDVLRLYGLDIDKFRNPHHSAHDVHYN